MTGPTEDPRLPGDPRLPEECSLAWQDDDLDEAALELLGGEVQPAFELLVATTDPDLREHRTAVLSEAGLHQLPALAAFAEDHEDVSSALLLQGSALQAAGFAARGSATIRHTGGDQIGEMYTHVRAARRVLHRAADLAPDDAVPWSQLMHCALGAPDHEPEWDEVYAEFTKRSPDLYGGNHVRLSTLARKWHGSQEQLIAFARERVAQLPDGHPLMSLIPMGHIEGHVDDLMRGNVAVRVWRAIHMGYLKKEAVRSEVDSASDRLLAGGFAGHPRLMSAHQVFATYYTQAQDKDRLRKHLELSGPRPSRWPWGYFGNHTTLFADARTSCGL